MLFLKLIVFSKLTHLDSGVNGNIKHGSFKSVKRYCFQKNKTTYFLFFLITMYISTKVFSENRPDSLCFYFRMLFAISRINEKDITLLLACMITLNILGIMVQRILLLKIPIFMSLL